MDTLQNKQYASCDSQHNIIHPKDATSWSQLREKEESSSFHTADLKRYKSSIRASRD